MPEINQVELEVLKNSLIRLVGNQYLANEDTRLLKTRTGISIHGCRFRHVELSDSMIQNNLSLYEIEKISQFKEQTRRKQYYTGRILAKRCLSDLININLIDFKNITIGSDNGGNQFCNLSVEGIEFKGNISISHKGEYVIVAGTTEGEVGLDLEELTKHQGIERRISLNHTEGDVRRFNTFLETAFPEISLNFSYTIIWSALEAGFKAFYYLDSKSPIEFKLIVEKEKVSIIHRAEPIVSKSVYITLAGKYILTIVA
ncbi:MAG: 4'-phosphopantetheinyl transferase family protein [Candidatus Sifarchaeia archaeon]